MRTQDEATTCASFPEVRRTVAIGERLKLAPCVSESFPRQRYGNTGLPCPRVVLDPDNVPAAELLPYLLHEDLRPLARDAFRAVTRPLPREERAAILGRVSALFYDERIAHLRRENIRKAIEEETKAARARGA